jgi:hypothetical protein
MALLSLAHLTLIDAGPLELIDAAAAGRMKANPATLFDQ